MPRQIGAVLVKLQDACRVKPEWRENVASKWNEATGFQGAPAMTAADMSA